MYSSGICQCTKEREVNVQKPGQNDWMRGGREALCCISEPACRQEWIYFTAGLEIPFLLGVIWYKALHQQQGLCGNWEKEGIALIFFGEVSSEKRRPWGNQPETKSGESQPTPSVRSQYEYYSL